MGKRILSATGEAPACPFMSTTGMDAKGQVGVLKVPCLETGCRLWNGQECSFYETEKDKDVAKTVKDDKE